MLETENREIKKIEDLLLGSAVDRKDHKQEKVGVLHKQSAKPRMSGLERNVEVALRPTREALELLIKALKKSSITYQLTHLIHLFLEQDDRFEVFITALRPDGLFCTAKNSLPFLTRRAAQNYLVDKYWRDVFEEIIVYLDPPKGNFGSVNCCGITGVLLGPPNYHLYNDLLKTHYDDNLSDSYSREEFLKNIRNDKSEEAVQKWLKKMTENSRYQLKSDPNVCFQDFRFVREFLINNPSLMPDSVKSIDALQIKSSTVSKIVDARLRAQIEQKIKNERHLPISLGCFCRLRFRQAGLHLYKKRNGQLYTSLVCSVKRKMVENNPNPSRKFIAILKHVESHPLETLSAFAENFLKEYPEFGNWEDSRSILVLKRDAANLVTRGYITQFEDGTLYLPLRPTRVATKDLKDYA